MNKINDILDKTGYYILSGLIDKNLVKEIKKDILKLKMYLNIKIDLKPKAY